MIKYIKDSIRELKHVVWPTRKETTNYFIIVTILLVLFGLYLFIASTIFTKSLFGLKELVNSNKTSNEINLPDTKTISDKPIVPKVDSTKIDNSNQIKVDTKTTQK